MKKSRYFVLASLLALLLIVAGPATGCTNEPAPVTYFPVQIEPHDSCPNGAIEGKLVLENGMLCMVLGFDSGARKTLLVWPYGFSWRTEGDTIHVLDSDGRLAIRLGDAVKMGGMDINLENLRSFVNTLAAPPIPEDYSGPLFVVCGSIINDTLDLEKARERLNLPDK